jgi:acyl-coenzyme A thioesterase PaaI-like protein
MERSGISGRSNPIAPPMAMWADGDLTRGRAFYTAVYEGPPGCLHGGFVAAAFDDLLGYAQIASGMAGYTGTLTVRMLKPTPLYQNIDYDAAVDRVEGRKIFVTGRSWCGPDLLAECEIVFIQPRTGSPMEGPFTPTPA